LEKEVIAMKASNFKVELDVIDDYHGSGSLARMVVKYLLQKNWI
jgi:hypothetical protein